MTAFARAAAFAFYRIFARRTKRDERYMKNFLTSLFSSPKDEDSAEEKAKNDLKNFDILKYDGVRAMRMRKMDYAIRCFREALSIEEDFETMNYLSGAYSAMNRHEEALEVLNRMVELQPEDVSTLLSRVGVLFMLDKDAEVIADCMRVIEIDEGNHVAWFLMAKAKRATGDLLGAVGDLTKAIALKDDFTDAYLLRAEVLRDMQQPKEALPDAEKAVTLAEEEETVYLVRGTVHEALGEIDAAAEDYQHALDLNPFNEEACIRKGVLLLAGGFVDEAIALFDEAIEMCPDFARAYAERGRAKNIKGDKDGAFEDLKKSIELNPDGEMAKRIEGEHCNFDDLYKGGIF